MNDNNTATLLVDSISGLGCSVNWIGHTGWENRNRLAGSRHFENAARVMVLVESRMSLDSYICPDQDVRLRRGIRTRVTKANGALQTAPWYWTATYDARTGLRAVEPATEQDWPTLFCTASTGEGDKRCGRRTWDGVLASGQIHCARHRGEDDEE